MAKTIDYNNSYMTAGGYLTTYSDGTSILTPGGYTPVEPGTSSQPLTNTAYPKGTVLRNKNTGATLTTTTDNELINSNWTVVSTPAPVATPPATSPATQTNQQQAATIAAQLADLQAQQAALQQWGLSDTNQIVKNSSGQYVPTPETQAQLDQIANLKTQISSQTTTTDAATSPTNTATSTPETTTPTTDPNATILAQVEALKTQISSMQALQKAMTQYGSNDTNNFEQDEAGNWILKQGVVPQAQLIEGIQKQIADLKAQQSALSQYGLTDTNDLEYNQATGQYFPKEGVVTPAQQKIIDTQKQIADLQAQQTALQQYGLSDTDELKLDPATGQYVPKTATQDERAAALAEAEQYYGYTLPTNQSPYGYAQREADINKQYELESSADYKKQQYNLSQIDQEKQKLGTEYQQYLQDVETGKLRAGSDLQKTTEQNLEQKRIKLLQMETEYKVGMDTLQRNWIVRGGLFSGVRMDKANTFATGMDLEKQSYVSGQEYNQAQLQSDYDRKMEDYLKNAGRTGQEYATNVANLGAEQSYLTGQYDIGVQQAEAAKLKDIRSMQDVYAELIAKRQGSTLSEKYGTRYNK